MEIAIDEALDSAIEVLGENPSELADGVFLSADGRYLVRMTDSDLEGRHGGGPHINVERGYLRTKANGRPQFKSLENKHVFLRVP